MPSTTEMLARSTDAMSRRFAEDACRAKHGHLTRAAIYGQWFVEALKDAGLPENLKGLGSDVHTTLGIIIDALSEAAGLIEKDADNHGIAPENFPLDTVELVDLWQKMKPAAPLFGDIARLRRPA